jgi:hypothetical protein
MGGKINEEEPAGLEKPASGLVVGVPLVNSILFPFPILQKRFPEPDDAPLFVWLDAHYSGGITAGEQDKCPVIAEINSIDMVRQSINTIVLIDDARGFLGQNEWPYLSDVVHAFKKGDWHVAAIDDVLIATSKNNLEVLLDDADKASRLFALERAAGQWQLLNIPLKTFSLLSRNRVLLVTRKLLFLLTTRVRRKN